MMRPFGWGMEDASAAAFLERLGPMLLMAGLELRAPDAGRRFTAAVCAAGSAGAHAAFEAAVAALPLLPPRVALPRDIAEACCASSVPRDRVRCSLGMSMHDLLAVMAAEEGGSLLPVCDWVLFPRTEGDVAAVLRYASAAGLAVVTRGGGTSVTGGLAVDARGRSGVVCLDMRRLSGVVSVDAEAMTARVLGGTTGPDLEAALRPYGLTARHFPQSFEYATVGGMVATRNGGHFASGPTKVDDICLAVRLVTPDAGVIASSLTVLSSGAPSLVRLVCGSEGECDVGAGAPPTGAAAAAVDVDVHVAVAATTAVAGSCRRRCGAPHPLYSAQAHSA
jgi:alkyldihydroxyacetonephosphate synthase